MMKLTSGKTHQYAPLWIAAFSAGMGLLRLFGERALVEGERKLKWSDLSTVATGALAGYLIFRWRRGSKEGGLFTR